MLPIRRPVGSRKVEGVNAIKVDRSLGGPTAGLAYRWRGGDAERWVVVSWVVDVCTAVDRIVTLFLEVTDDVLFEFISGMVGA